MLALERRNEILEKLHRHRRVVVSELSQLYGVSEETIRRDLDKLEKEGYAIKSYGGAVFNEDLNIDLPFNVRKNRNVAGKQRIAELVEPLVWRVVPFFLYLWHVPSSAFLPTSPCKPSLLASSSVWCRTP